MDDDFEMTTEAQGERIAKRISRAGLCSRRKAEEWIAEGRVKVNGKVIDTPAIRVLPEDDVRVDGKSIIPPEPTRVWIFHKPKGYLTTNHDPEGRPTIFDVLPTDLPRVITVGRLDMNSEGLLILTNNGEVARHMELPTTGWTRRYRVRVFGTPSNETLRQLKKGMKIDDVYYGSVSAKIEREQGSNCWLEVALNEGKKREIRILFEHMGHSVSRLIRVSYGPFQLGKLECGDVMEVQKRVLKSQLPKELLV